LSFFSLLSFRILVYVRNSWTWLAKIKDHSNDGEDQFQNSWNRVSIDFYFTLSKCASFY
jgi:hypothetical protein